MLLTPETKDKKEKYDLNNYKKIKDGLQKHLDIIMKEYKEIDEVTEPILKNLNPSFSLKAFLYKLKKDSCFVYNFQQ